MEVINRTLQVVDEEILTSGSVPQGMPLHIADIHMEELSKYVEQGMGDLSQEEMEAMF